MSGGVLRGLALVSLLAVGLVTAGMARSLPDPPADHAATSAASMRFLDDYLADDGRVVRHDQGGDTVSEGQAYAMLVAAAFGDRRRFDLAWGWTRTNLQRPDGLLAWRWQDGEVRDRQPATDADLDAARALLLASERFGPRAYAEEGLRIGAAILDHSTVRVGGRELLVAGPWARVPPATINPSYFSPAAFVALERASGNPRWIALGTASAEVVDELTRSGLLLPSDWARIDETGVVSSALDLDGEGVFGLDAQRLPVRMGEDCGPDGRRIAAALWPFLGAESERGDVALSYTLSGVATTAFAHPLGVVAAAAAAAAAGLPERRDQLLDRAEALERAHPTYYGAAWVALGRLMLTTDLLGDCGAPADSAPATEESP